MYVFITLGLAEQTQLFITTNVMKKTVTALSLKS